MRLIALPSVKEPTLSRWRHGIGGFVQMSLERMRILAGLGGAGSNTDTHTQTTSKAVWALTSKQSKHEDVTRKNAGPCWGWVVVQTQTRTLGCTYILKISFELLCLGQLEPP